MVRHTLQDAQIEAYLNAVAEYQQLKAHAGTKWSDAFLYLAKARLAYPVTPEDHDPAARPTIQLRNGELVAEPSTAMTGAWPSESLRLSQRDFIKALALEIECHRLRAKINSII